MNGSRMRTSILRLTGIVILAFGALSVVWWISSDDPRQTERNERATEPPAPARDAPRTTDAPPGINAPRSDTAEVENGFDFPFLGKVRSQMRMQEITTKAEDGTTLAMPFRVYVDERGQFRRAEFAQEGTGELELPVARIERAMQATEEKVLGLPKAPAPVPWQKVIATIAQKVPMKEIKRMNMTYVDYQVMDRTPEPVFIVNVFGFDAMPPPAYSAKRDPKWKRTRFICDAAGEVMLMDDCL